MLVLVVCVRVKCLDSVLFIVYASTWSCDVNVGLLMFVFGIFLLCSRCLSCQYFMGALLGKCKYILKFMLVVAFLRLNCLLMNLWSNYMWQAADRKAGTTMSYHYYNSCCFYLF